MEIRAAKVSDMKAILEIVADAREYFKNAGIDQWQGVYPAENNIMFDIENEQSYVIVDGDKVVGTTAISFMYEKTYENIEDGKWLTDCENSAVIHRTAVSSDYKGRNLSKMFIDYAEELCKERGVPSIKVDTHKDNKSMIRFIEKSGFEYCGVIYSENSPRVAFEKVL